MSKRPLVALLVLLAIPMFNFAQKDADWLARFHAGDSKLLERCYHEHASAVLKAAARVVGAADAENVAHDVFYRMLSESDFRQMFHGGNVGAWLCTVARNAAMDLARRRAKERALPHGDAALGTVNAAESGVDADLFVAGFVRDVLPPDLMPLFEARFLEQRTQRDAADMLGMPRSTLIYQENRIRQLLHQYAAQEPR